MKIRRDLIQSLALSIVLSLLVAACETTPTSQPSANKPSVQMSRADQALADGINLFDRGDFNGAIAKLSGSEEIWSGPASVQVQAHKYLGFSYCVTNRPTQCRTEFEKAFKLQPTFDLSPGEKGHPQWGPVFERAKREQQKT